MKFGIIAEGRGDQAVITNILIGLNLVDNISSQITYLRPKYALDKTDSAMMEEDEHGSWTWVKKECQERKKLDLFLGENNPFDVERIVIIHLDTAECHEPEFGVTRPAKENENYCELLRIQVIEKIMEWLENNYAERLKFAIAIEETEAWIHALFEDKDTSKSFHPKETFGRYLTKNGIKVRTNDAYQRAKSLSDDFTKLKRRKVSDRLKFNLSLLQFVESLKLTEG